jgi:hypothetical protein
MANIARTEFEEEEESSSLFEILLEDLLVNGDDGVDVVDSLFDHLEAFWSERECFGLLKKFVMMIT